MTIGTDRVICDSFMQISPNDLTLPRRILEDKPEFAEGFFLIGLKEKLFGGS